MTAEQERRRVEYQALTGALTQLDDTNPQAALLIAGLTRAIVAEANRSSRFAQSLTDVIAGLGGAGETAGQSATGERVAPAMPVTRKRAGAPRKRVVRQPGAFDPFVVFRESGADMLSAKLSELEVDGLRDIIAEQALDTRKETGRKRKPEVLVAWIVEKVQATEAKGSVFR